MGKRINQHNLASDLLNKVDECFTEADIEEVSAIAEKSVQADCISKVAYDIIKWALDCRADNLVTDELIKEV